MNDMWLYAQATGQLKQNGAWYTLEVIGRPDLNVEKNMRADDMRKYLREKNLWEVFVMQVFSGSAWGHELTPAQLEILGVVRTSGVPDIITPEEEALMQKGIEDLKGQLPGEVPIAAMADM
jgi:hypothetical protein